ncbi:MAG: helix-turn-helix transcriptional regulator, partial [Hungatella sp.]|nr:helix-turn-helix transcriptional regulator [Hungatella sp.]
MPITIELGLRIRAIRKSRNLSQEQLAELCNLHPTYIGQL